MGDWFSILERLIACLSPIFIAWCGWKITTSERKSKEYRELKEKYEIETEEKRQLERRAHAELLKETAEKVETLSDEIAELRRGSDHSAIEKNLQALMSLSNTNFQYCRSLSRVVSSIGKALVSTGTLEDPTEVQLAIRQHEEDEQKLTDAIFKIQY